MRQLQLLDSVFGLALLNATFALPFPVIILSQMLRELPIELEEAAQVDGASRWQAFYRCGRAPHADHATADHFGAVGATVYYSRVDVESGEGVNLPL